MPPTNTTTGIVYVRGGNVFTTSANTFTALNKFSGGLESYENNHADNTEGVILGQSAGANDESNAINIGFFAGGGAGGNGGVPTGAGKTNIGRHAGFSATGANSVAIGHAANQYGYNSGHAVAIGYLAARNQSQDADWNSFDSVVIGRESFALGDDLQTATAVGAYAGRQCTDGVGATLLGYRAGETAANLRECVYIGSQAGYSLNRSKTLVIESDSTLAPPGVGGLIYGEFDNRILHFGASKVVANGFISPLGVAAPVTTAGAATYTAAQFATGLVLRDPNGGDRSDVTPTAALLVASIPQAAVGNYLEFTIRNTADNPETITITAGNNCTLSGTMTIAQNTSRRFRAELTNVGSGTETYTLYSVGSFTT